MGIADHDATADYPFPREVVFRALLPAIPSQSGLQIISVDQVAWRIVAKAGMSFRSWGEKIFVAVSEISPEQTRVTITSTPKTGAMLGGLFDLGKNRGNTIRSVVCIKPRRTSPKAISTKRINTYRTSCSVREAKVFTRCWFNFQRRVCNEANSNLVRNLISAVDRRGLCPTDEARRETTVN